MDAIEPFGFGIGFAGDFYGRVSPVTVQEGRSTVERDLPVRKILRLTAPKDNSKVIGTIGNRSDISTYDFHGSDELVFSWEAVPEANRYRAS